MKDIKSLTLSQLKEEMAALGEKPFRAKQLYEWMHVKLARDYGEMTNIPKSLIAKCRENYTYTSLKEVTYRPQPLMGRRSSFLSWQTVIWWKVYGCSIIMAIQSVFPLR